MTTQEKLNDLKQTGNFNSEELEQNEKHFKSWEFWLIRYYSNAELYYLDDETEKQNEQSADEIIDTEKGRAYCFR